MELLPLMFFFGGNAVALGLSLYMLVVALARARRKVLPALLYLGALLAIGALYLFVIGPRVKATVPLFTGSLLEFVGLLFVHTAIPCFGWLLPGIAVRWLARSGDPSIHPKE